MSFFPTFAPVEAAVATLEFGGTGVDGTNKNSVAVYTFSGLAIGTAAADRKVVVIISGTGIGGADAVSAVTVGGVSGTAVVSLTHSAAGDFTEEIWQADVPTGTTADVVVTWSATQMRSVGVGTYAVYGAASAAAATGTTETDAANVAMTVPAGGVSFGGTGSNVSTGSVAWSSNLTEGYDELVESGVHGHSGAAKTNATALTAEDFYADWTSPGARIFTCFAAWGPA
jgi:hypothetical protein